jgi:hypothetical protein
MSDRSAGSTSPDDFFPSLRHVWLVAALVLMAIRPLIFPIPPHDFWWHLATGRLIVDTGGIPVVDVFSFTRAGEPVYSQAWLAQIFMYGLFRLGGVHLIILFQAAVITLAYGLLLRVCVLRTGYLKLSVFLLILTLPVSFSNWMVRPQTYTLPLFAAYLTILPTWRLKPDHHRLWLLPLLMVVWVNTHGSFVLGPVLIALAGAGSWLQGLIGRSDAPPRTERPRLWRLALWGLITVAACAANPRGVQVVRAVLAPFASPVVTDIVTEWAAPTLHTTTGALFFALSALLACALALNRFLRRRLEAADLLMAAAFFALALTARRYVVWFAMAGGVLFVVYTAALMPATVRTDGSPGKRGPNIVIVAALLGLLALATPWMKPWLNLPPTVQPLLAPSTPVEAVEVLRADPDPARRLFHSEGYGSYLTWAAPGQPVFIDPRFDLYPAGQWRDYLDLSRGTSADSLLGAYGIDGLLLEKESQSGLLRVVREDPQWELRFENAGSAYLRRTGD